MGSAIGHTLLTIRGTKLMFHPITVNREKAKNLFIASVDVVEELSLHAIEYPLSANPNESFVEFVTGITIAGIAHIANPHHREEVVFLYHEVRETVVKVTKDLTHKIRR
jgi:hypothetical protein